MSQHTAYHAPIQLADERAKRRLRAGRVAPDFTFAEPVKKAAVTAMPETADEITERLMQRLRTTEPVASTWLRMAVWVGVPLLCFGAAVAIYLAFN